MKGYGFSVNAFVTEAFGDLAGAMEGASAIIAQAGHALATHGKARVGAQHRPAVAGGVAQADVALHARSPWSGAFS